MEVEGSLLDRDSVGADTLKEHGDEHQLLRSDQLLGLGTTDGIGRPVVDRCRVGELLEPRIQLEQCLPVDDRRHVRKAASGLCSHVELRQDDGDDLLGGLLGQRGTDRVRILLATEKRSGHGDRELFARKLLRVVAVLANEFSILSRILPAQIAPEALVERQARLEGFLIFSSGVAGNVGTLFERGNEAGERLLIGGVELPVGQRIALSRPFGSLRRRSDEVCDVAGVLTTEGGNDDLIGQIDRLEVRRPRDGAATREDCSNRHGGQYCIDALHSAPPFPGVARLVRAPVGEQLDQQSLDRRSDDEDDEGTEAESEIRPVDPHPEDESSERETSQEAGHNQVVVPCDRQLSHTPAHESQNGEGADHRQQRRDVSEEHSERADVLVPVEPRCAFVAVREGDRVHDRRQDDVEDEHGGQRDAI